MGTMITNRKLPRKRKRYSSGGTIAASVAIGAGTGALGGAALGGVAAIPGAVIGGGVGLVKGIMQDQADQADAKLKSDTDKETARRLAENKARDDSMQDMAQKLAYNNNISNNRFYPMGGRMRTYAGGGRGVMPVNSTDGIAQGPSHAQGGVPIGGGAEVEGQENVRQNPMTGETEIDSARMGTAQANQPLMEAKGQIEQQIQELKVDKAKRFAKSNKVVSFRKGNEIERGMDSIDNAIGQMEQQLQQIQQEIDANFQQQQAMNGDSQGQPEGAPMGQGMGPGQGQPMMDGSGQGRGQGMEMMQGAQGVQAPYGARIPGRIDPPNNATVASTTGVNPNMSYNEANINNRDIFKMQSDNALREERYYNKYNKDAEAVTYFDYWNEQNKFKAEPKVKEYSAGGTFVEGDTIPPFDVIPPDKLAYNELDSGVVRQVGYTDLVRGAAGVKASGFPEGLKPIYDDREQRQTQRSYNPNNYSIEGAPTATIIGADKYKAPPKVGYTYLANGASSGFPEGMKVPGQREDEQLARQTQRRYNQGERQYNRGQNKLDRLANQANRAAIRQDRSDIRGQNRLANQKDNVAAKQARIDKRDDARQARIDKRGVRQTLRDERKAAGIGFGSNISTNTGLALGQAGLSAAMYYLNKKNSIQDLKDIKINPLEMKKATLYDTNVDNTSEQILGKEYTAMKQAYNDNPTPENYARMQQMTDQFSTGLAKLRQQRSTNSTQITNANAQEVNNTFERNSMRAKYNDEQQVDKQLAINAAEKDNMESLGAGLSAATNTYFGGRRNEEVRTELSKQAPDYLLNSDIPAYTFSGAGGKQNLKDYLSVLSGQTTPGTDRGKVLEDWRLKANMTPQQWTTFLKQEGYDATSFN